ncbi:MAG: polysaccharide biosynthesis/export family protein [Kiritimatiellia bacterium]|jgi:polysaccharide export outer membrane protein
MQDMVSNGNKWFVAGSVHQLLKCALVPVTLGAGLLMGGACSNPKPSLIRAEYTLPPRAMALQCGDLLAIRFFGAPELNSEQVIRHDGNIVLSLIGEIEAAGLTPGELQLRIRDRYASQLQIKDVSVIVREPAPVLVGGEVLRPGRVPLSRPMTVLDAIMEAGGFVPGRSEPRAVVVVRHKGDQRERFVLNYQEVLAGNGRSRPFYVQPFDLIHVPLRWDQ